MSDDANSISASQLCACTRSLDDHTKPDEDVEEEIRRAKVALRIDELLRVCNCAFGWHWAHHKHIRT